MEKYIKLKKKLTKKITKKNNKKKITNKKLIKRKLTKKSKKRKLKINKLNGNIGSPSNGNIGSIPEDHIKLLKIQKDYFPKIITELKKNDKKVSCWNWYVFPNTYSSSDPNKTKVTNNDAELEQFLLLSDIPSL